MKRGELFDTEFETGCKVEGKPDQYGNFLAYDSEGVLCMYSTAMVIPHRQMKIGGENIGEGEEHHSEQAS